MSSRIIAVQGKVEVGSHVTVAGGGRFEGKTGRVVKINGRIATVSGPFGGYGYKGRKERDFCVEYISLFTEDMDESTREYH